MIEKLGIAVALLILLGAASVVGVFVWAFIELVLWITSK